MAYTGARFKWTRQTELAAVLVAEDKLTDQQIADQLGITRVTLHFWKTNPKFQARVAELVAEFRRSVLNRGIAVKANRVATLQDLERRLLMVVEERASDPSMAPVPGGKSGFLVRRLKGIGRGDDYRTVEEYESDVGLSKEIREVGKQAAKECGQWVETGDGGAESGPDEALPPDVARQVEAAAEREYIKKMGVPEPDDPPE